MRKTIRKTVQNQATAKRASPMKATARAARRETPKKAITGSAVRRRAVVPGSRGGMLSSSTLRSKWIESVDEHEERHGQSLATRDHEVIRRWAEARGALPATVPGTEYGDRPGVLRFDFPGFGGKGLKLIAWVDWFKPFDQRNLVFVFQEHLKSGAQSNFFRIDSPTREAA